MGLWAAVIMGIPINIAQLWGQDILIATGQTPETSALAGRYLLGLTWSMIPAWGFIAFRNFMGAVNRPEPGLWINHPLWTTPPPHPENVRATWY